MVKFFSVSIWTLYIMAKNFLLLTFFGDSMRRFSYVIHFVFHAYLSWSILLHAYIMNVDGTKGVRYAKILHYNKFQRWYIRKIWPISWGVNTVYYSKMMNDITSLDLLNCTYWTPKPFRKKIMLAWQVKYFPSVSIVFLKAIDFIFVQLHMHRIMLCNAHLLMSCRFT